MYENPHHKIVFHNILLGGAKHWGKRQESSPATATDATPWRSLIPSDGDGASMNDDDYTINGDVDIMVGTTTTRSCSGDRTLFHLRRVSLSSRTLRPRLYPRRRRRLSLSSALQHVRPVYDKSGITDLRCRRAHNRQSVGLKTLAGQGAPWTSLLGRADPTRPEARPDVPFTKGMWHVLSFCNRIGDVLPCTTPKSKDVHFPTINNAGSPPACSIEDSAVGFTAIAHTWTGLGLPGSAFTPEHWRRCRGTLLRVLKMANHQEDGHTASDSESQNNSRSRGRGVSDKQPSPRKSRPPPRRSAEPHSKPTHYEFMGLVNGHNERLDRLEQELAQ
ncbi:hypothetical protein PIB30_021198 [Stylosanthes scabra]|uniref:Uncharacterized protein n=1 Tax=Stylosanthes scabra TaxID=79078 RepID=A0ABU6U9U3_9FABA|nr:hypothetical protein [Stylosanthes scabra]